jgi:hypothetical protein
MSTIIAAVESTFNPTEHFSNFLPDVTTASFTNNSTILKTNRNADFST